MTLADTLQNEELLGLDNETLLHRLYHQETVRLFDPRAFASVVAALVNARPKRWSV